MDVQGIGKGLAMDRLWMRKEKTYGCERDRQGIAMDRLWIGYGCERDRLWMQKG